MSCFTTQITTALYCVIINMTFLFSHPKCLEAPEKKLPGAPSTADKGTEIQLSKDMHSTCIHTVAVWNFRILETKYKSTLGSFK